MIRSSDAAITRGSKAPNQTSEATPQTNKMYFGGDRSERIIREVGSG